MAKIPDKLKQPHDASPAMPLAPEAEQAYRQAYYAAAREAAQLNYDDFNYAYDAAWMNHAALKHPHPNAPSTDHAVEAAKIQARFQALEFVNTCWGKLHDDSLPDEVFMAFVLKPWADRIEPWVSQNLVLPFPHFPPNDILDGQQQKILSLFKPLAPQIEKKRIYSTYPRMKCAGELIMENPWMKTPVLEGLLRQGETMNIISASKIGKSWMGTDLALAVATGRMWLDRFSTVPGYVLLVDNELHPETTANRIPKIAQARGIELAEYEKRFYIENMRGRLKNLLELGPYFEAIDPGRFSLIILDALYRFIPSESSENDNAMMANIYNLLDQIASRLACAIVCIHHASKGIQSSKSITDVGAGAGSQARACDTHLILRPHEEPNAVVLEAAVRSWPPVEPLCLRWDFPVWLRDDSLDPTALRSDRTRRKKKVEKEPKPAPLEWTPEKFVETFLAGEPQEQSVIFKRAKEEGISQRRAKKLLHDCEINGAVHRWKFGANKPVKYAITPPPEEAKEPKPVRARTSP